MKKLIKNGMICTESQVFPGDILIEGEKIKACLLYTSPSPRD